MLDQLESPKAKCFLLNEKAKGPPGRGGNLLDVRTSWRYDPNDPPTIRAQQNSWFVDFYDFSRSSLPLQHGWDFFNCALLELPQADWLIVRRSRWFQGCPFGMNDLVAYQLEDSTQPRLAKPLTIPARFAAEHFEDPRAFLFDGRIFLNCCNFIWAPRYSGAHQLMVEFDQQWQFLKRHDVVYGGNGEHCYANKGSEKNWIWFVHDNHPHLVYMNQPHLVTRFDWNFRPLQQWQTASPDMAWHYGVIRGGTPPRLVNGEYWSFYHSSVDWAPGGVRRYHMGAYSFEAGPPFKILRYTPVPILSGSRQDRWGESKPYVVFPCGTIFRHNHWLVSLGVNDLDCAYASIPHDDLVSLTKTL